MPNMIQAQIPHLATFLATHPFPVRGVHGANETSSNEQQRLFTHSRESLSGGYTSHDFVTVGHTCAITTALQPPTSIYRGLLTIPKVESILPLNSHSLISTDLSVGVSTGTPPHCSKKHSWRILPPLKPPHLKHRQSPSDQVRSLI